ncbi:MAG: ADP-ribosylglycohydrolase family protein [Candidatus Aminicenantales bacterium]
MKSLLRRRLARWAGIGLLVFSAGCRGAMESRTLSLAGLEDKIRGGWAGKMIGVSFGAPTEFEAQGKIFEDPLTWSPERIDKALEQDDLYVGMTMSETMDRLGFEATVADYGEAFKESKYGLWHANACARRLLNMGVPAPLSSDPKYNAHGNDIDFQIEADFIGLMCPGLPQIALLYSERVGRVMNYGDGLYGGVWLNGMYAAAFFESDPRKVVDAGLACLPSHSSYAAILRDVLDWSRPGGDWRRVWEQLEVKWDKDDSCPDGAGRSFNIDAKLNGAYIALALLMGEGDFDKTLEIAARAGQDSDCNPSSAAGVLGVITGCKAIPDKWKSGIPAVADRKFDFTNSSYNDICRATLNRALMLVKRAGGDVKRDSVRIPVQAPVPAELEQWEMGVEARRIGLEDAAFQWKGRWTPVSSGNEAAPAAEATLQFTGAAVAIQGDFFPDGGRADVFLDGELQARPIDAYVGDNTFDNVLWHVYGLKPGAHTVRIVVRNDADPRSKGKKLIIQNAVVYQAASSPSSKRF